MNDSKLTKQEQGGVKKNIWKVIKDPSSVAFGSQDLDFPQSNSHQSGLQNLPEAKLLVREAEFMGRKNHTVNPVAKIDRVPKKAFNPLEQKSIKRVVKNYNEFARLLEKDENRKAYLLECLEQKIHKLKDNVSRIYKGEIKEQNSQISFLDSCKNFNLDVSTVSAMLKQHKFKFESEKSEDEDGQTTDGGRRQKKKESKSSPGDLLTYFMLFNMVGQKTEKRSTLETNPNDRQLMDLEEKLREHNSRMTEVLQAKNKTPFPVLPLLKAPKIEKSPSFHGSVMEKLDAIQARLSESHALPNHPREGLHTREKTDFSQKKDFTRKYRRVHEQMMIGMQHNLLGLDRALQRHVSQARPQPAYMPMPLR